MVEHLHSKGVPIALATSSSQDSVDIKMKKFPAFMGLFHHLTMGSTDPEVTKGKPDPAIFLVCASRFPDKPKPEDVSKLLVIVCNCYFKFYSIWIKAHFIMHCQHSLHSMFYLSDMYPVSVNISSNVPKLTQTKNKQLNTCNM